MPWWNPLEVWSTGTFQCLVPWSSVFWTWGVAPPSKNLCWSQLSWIMLFHRTFQVFLQCSWCSRVLSPMPCSGPLDPGRFSAFSVMNGLKCWNQSEPYSPLSQNCSPIQSPLWLAPEFLNIPNSWFPCGMLLGDGLGHATQCMSSWSLHLILTGTCMEVLETSKFWVNTSEYTLQNVLASSMWCLEVAPCRETTEWNETASPHQFLSLSNVGLNHHGSGIAPSQF